VLNDFVLSMPCTIYFLITLLEILYEIVRFEVEAWTRICVSNMALRVEHFQLLLPPLIQYFGRFILRFPDLLRVFLCLTRLLFTEKSIKYSIICRVTKNTFQRGIRNLIFFYHGFESGCAGELPNFHADMRHENLRLEHYSKSVLSWVFCLGTE